MYPQITQLQTARRLTGDELERERQVSDARRARPRNGPRAATATISRRLLARVRLARA